MWNTVVKEKIHLISSDFEFDQIALYAPPQKKSFQVQSSQDFILLNRRMTYTATSENIKCSAISAR